MGKVTLEEIEYQNFGKCLRISNGEAEAVVTTDIGPRVIRYSLCGGENILKEDLERKLCSKNPEIKQVFGEDAVFYNYGGQRIWLSPEDMPLSYCPDNSPVQVKKLPCGAEFTAQPQRVNNVQLRMTVELDETGTKLHLGHYAANVGESSMKKALWCLTVLSTGGLEIVPMPQNDTGLLSNRVMAVWPYADCGDQRLTWYKKYLALRQDEAAATAFKIGLNNNRGWAAYLNHGDLFIKRFRHNPNGSYPDYGCSFETYTNPDFLEMETLGELVNLTPGSTMFHAESWELVPGVARPAKGDEAAIDALVAAYIEK